MNAAVIYSSRQGSARRYAQTIAQALDAQLIEAGTVKPARLDGFDTLVFGGGVMAGGIAGANMLKKNAPRWSGKRIAMFAVGLSDPAEPGLRRKLLEQNLPESLRESAGFWVFRG
ncbi:MAG: flavodoxin domain-containing protein, partial [Eubacteriales bacterium]|nr:flavodoxin domain-containing protein [Eubacteriales bacterium]